MTTKTKLVAPPRESRASLERKAFVLSQRCPAEPPNPPDCPLFDLRPMTPRARRNWLHRLTRDELEYLLAYHRGCLGEKTSARRAPAV